MSKKLTFKQFEQLVEDQGNQILEAMAYAATGRFDHEVEIPEGIEALTDIAIGLTYLLDDFNQLLNERDKIAQELEERVKERTAELEQTLEELRTTQKIYIEREWTSYLALDEENESEEPFLLSPEWLPATVDAIEKKSPISTVINGNQKPGVAVPIPLFGDELVGLFGFQGENFNIDPEEMTTVEAIVEQVGLALENQRLFDQTQQALSETESLYFASEGVNRAQSINRVLEVLGETIDARGAQRVHFMELDTFENGRPTWMVLKESWIQNDDSYVLPIGSRFELKNYAILNEVLAENPQIALVNNVFTDPRTKDDENLKAILELTQTKAVVYLPLLIGQRFIGLITVQWEEPQNLTTREHRFINTLGAQVATAIDGIRLLEDAQERARELAAISDIQNRLSVAVNDNDILASVASAFKDAELALHYVETGPAETVLTMQTVSKWRNGDLDLAYPRLGKTLPAAEIPTAPYWFSDSRNITHIANFEKDPRTIERAQELIDATGLMATCAVPLRSAGRWQAVLTLCWPEKHHLSHLEDAVLRSLAEPLGAIIASRRAQLAQQKAQAQTELLYNAGRRINEASGDLNEITAVLGEIREAGFNRAVLMEFRYNDKHDLRGIDITASWHNGLGTRPDGIGTQFTTAAFRRLGPVLEKTSQFLGNVPAEKSLNQETKQWLAEKNVVSMGVLPLFVGSQHIGTILLQGEGPHDFSEEEKRIYLSLSPQIAVAVQNQRLLKEAQSRARREQVLREVTEKVRNAPTIDMVMKTAATEIGRVFGRKSMIYFNQTPDNPIDPEN